MMFWLSVQVKRGSNGILDKGSDIGESWKNRYDSLTLYNLRFYSSLPGLILKGEEKSILPKMKLVII